MRKLSTALQKTVTLNGNEERLCKLLVDVTAHAQKTRPELPAVTCRIAGGWVRDKLLGLSCHDIDVALNSVSGADFAECVRAFVVEHLCDPSILGHHGHVAIIKSNPEKSKHLETATVRIFDIDVDFVNLRNETYQPGSRIPTITFGTPFEDACRRDLTINSLFYNIHTREVEDHLGKGLDDLRDGIVRTPLPPVQTFRDDPLRILRMIRFASRFDYSIVPEVKEAIQDHDIQAALGRIISRERIGEEVRKMLLGPRPLLSVEYMVQFGIYNTVFLPRDGDRQHQELSKELGDRILRVLASSNRLLTEYPHLVSLTEIGGDTSRCLDDNHKLSLLLSATLGLCFESHPVSDGATSRKKRISDPPVAAVTRDSLKLSNVVTDLVVAITTRADQARAMCAEIAEIPSAEHVEQMPIEDYRALRLRVGSFMRAIAERPLLDSYCLVFLYAAAYDHVVSCSQDRDRYEHFIQILAALELTTIHREPCLIDGKEVMQLSGNASPGKWLGDALESAIKWQISHGGPRGDADKNGCIEYVRSLLNEQRPDNDANAARRKRTRK